LKYIEKNPNMSSIPKLLGSGLKTLAVLEPFSDSRSENPKFEEGSLKNGEDRQKIQEFNFF
jgi:hypothetical protein